VLYWGCLICFPQNVHPTFAKPFSKSQILTLSLQLSTFHFDLALGALFAILEADFHKMKGSRSLKDLNTTDDNLGLNHSFPASAQLLLLLLLRVQGFKRLLKFFFSF
jgi:hypothetical protein